jgi:hypothetical protein
MRHFDAVPSAIVKVRREPSIRFSLTGRIDCETPFTTQVDRRRHWRGVLDDAV